MQTQYNRVRGEDLQPEMTTLLQTVLLVEEKYGANYLIRLLRGERQYVNQFEGHTQLPVFGAFRAVSSDQIRQWIQFAIKQDWLLVTHPIFGCLGLTEAGKMFLLRPEAVPVRAKQWKTTMLEKLLLVSLRKLRFELARAESVPAFRIFTDQSLQALVSRRPVDLKSLQTIPGMTDTHCNRYGGTILMCILRVLHQYENQVREQTRKRADQPAQQEVQALFESGFSTEEIAERRIVKTGTIIRSLEQLHLAGKLNLKSWVEEHVDSPTLTSARDWFHQHRHAPLREAYEALGLDYETLRLCRLYVDRVSQSEVDAPWAEAS